MSLYPWPENLTDISLLFGYANNVSDNIFGWGLLIVLYIISISYLIKHGNDFLDASIATGYFIVILGIFFYAMDWITGTNFFYCVFLLALFMFAKYVL